MLILLSIICNIYHVMVHFLPKKGASWWILMSRRFRICMAKIPKKQKCKFLATPHIHYNIWDLLIHNSDKHQRDLTISNTESSRRRLWNVLWTAWNSLSSKIISLTTSYLNQVKQHFIPLTCVEKTTKEQTLERNICWS